MGRFTTIARAFLAVFAVSVSGMMAHAEPIESFDSFLQGFERQAVEAGISRDVYRRATAGLVPRSNIPGLVRTQPEFTTPMWDYLEGRVSAGRIARGRKAMAAHKTLFDRIGKTYGVDPAILGAMWGMETDYGAVLGNKALITPIIRSLATLVHQRRGRLKADEKELIAALRLIQDKGWSAQSLVGSWAGAVGHTQVIASGLLAHGTDGDDDGIINPHLSLADALATSAVFLRALGYQSGSDWGFEVEVPKGFDFTLATRREMKPIGFFSDRGVKRVKGRQFADLELPVFLYVPTGKNGPIFLMTQNYLVLKSYNFSDSYALSVAHLTDRLKGAGPFVSSWPKTTKFPNLEQRIAIQKLLKQLGYYDGKVDGRVGPISQEAYQKFQTAQGVIADGFITLRSYELLRQFVR